MRIQALKDAIAGGVQAEIIAAADALNITDGSMLSNDMVRAINAAKGKTDLIQEPEDVKSNMAMVRMVDTDADGKVDEIDADNDGVGESTDADDSDETVQ
jgi:hypothetical protein